MSTLTYRTEARDAYLAATSARAIVLDQLIDVRQDDRSLEASGVTTSEVRAAFETIRKVSGFYENLLHHDAEEERQVNEHVTDELLSRALPAPVPASDVLEAGEKA